MSDPYTERVNALVPLFDRFNEITSQIQAEMAVAIIQDPKMREDLAKKSKLSENEMMKHLNKAVLNFIVQKAWLHTPRLLRSSQTLTPHGRAGRHPNGLSKNRASGFAGAVNPKMVDQT